MSQNLENSAFQIVTVNRPVIWPRDGEETWLLNPPRRYVLSADNVPHLEGYIETCSSLKSHPKYKPLRAGVNLIGKRILVERFRDRGIGDLLFLTGPLSYLQHVCSDNVTIDFYGLSERSQVLHDHPALSYRTVLTGPVHLDDFDLYAAHWLIENVTEFDESPDQLNVYDALYRSLGIDETKVDPRWKRPSVSLTKDDFKRLDSGFYHLWNSRKIDLRSTGYYVVAPLSHASLRSMSYKTWLAIIKELARKRPVVVIGQALPGRVPTTDLTYSAFVGELDELSAQHQGVINLLGQTHTRMMMALLSKAVAFVGLDSGPLYVAQALRTPAVSIWGTHSPEVRIGYDSAYMRNAIHETERCPHAPCFAYSRFPATRCPEGGEQRICEVLKVSADRVLAQVESAERE